MTVDHADSKFDSEFYLGRDKERGISYRKAVSPYAGECLEDLLIRAACENGFHPMMSYRLLGVKALTFPVACGTAFRVGISAKAISRVLGNEGGPSELEPLLWDKEPLPSRRLRFFGACLPPGALSGCRRVSPVALRRAPFLRAVWRIRALAFDTETKEQLLEKCPVCDRPFGTRFMGDVWCCDRCCVISTDGQLQAVDLREYPQPLVDERYWDDLDFATCFVDPKASERLPAARSKLHSDFDDLSNGDVFDFIAVLGRVMTGRARADQERQVGVPPAVFASAAKVVLNWPESFAELTNQTPPDECGLQHHPFRDLFYRHRRYQKAQQRMIDMARGTMLKAVHDRAAFLPSAFAFRSNELHAVRLSQRRIFKHTEPSALQLMATIVRSRSEVSTFARALGVTVPTLMDMADDDMFPSTLLHHGGDRYFVQNSNLFVDRLTSAASKLPHPRNLIRLPQVVAALFRRIGDPWPNLLRSMLGGDLPYWIVPMGRGSLMEGIHVSDFETVQRILAFDQRSLDVDYQLRISTREAGTFTRHWSEILRLARKAGLITLPHNRSSVSEFAAHYERTGSILFRLRFRNTLIDASQMRSSLKSAGVLPVIVTSRGRDLWPRSQVDAYFGKSIATGVVDI